MQFFKNVVEYLRGSLVFERSGNIGILYYCGKSHEFGELHRLRGKLESGTILEESSLTLAREGVRLAFA